MMPDLLTRLRRLGLACLIGLWAGSLAPAPASSQVVELNPVELSGTVQIGDFEIVSLGITARSNVGFSSSTVPVPGDSVEVGYSTIVQVPAGGQAFYRLNVNVGLRSPDTGQLSVFRYESPAGVFVSDGVPATLDYVLDPAAFVRATVTAQPGELIESVSLFAEGTDPNGFAIFDTSVEAPPGGVSALVVEMPVAPGVRMICRGGAGMTNGRGAALEPLQIVEAPDGGMGECDFVPAPPPATGGIRGVIDYAGDVPVDRYEVFVNREGSSGPEPEPLVLDPPFTGPGNRAMFEFSEVVEHDRYDVDARITLNGGIDQLLVELADDIGVSAGVVSTVLGGGDLCQAGLELDFSFGGLTPPAEWTLADEIRISRTDTVVSSGVRADPRDGPLSFLVTEGSWTPVLGFAIRRNAGAPGGFTSTDGVVRLAEPVAVECGETASASMPPLETGRVEVQFRVAGGGFLQFPTIQAVCALEDEQTGQDAYTYTASAGSATPTLSVAVGRVPVEPPAGVGDFTARGRVDGVNVTFCTLRDVEIVPGVEIVIGLEGPHVQIASPAPGATVDAPEIVVTGTATDDGEVVSVLVNGVDAELVPSGNPDDPREVAFTATVPLDSGDNRIAALATDDAGNETEASLHVENVMPPPPNAPPLVAITSPAPGSVVEDDVIVVEGIATDDVEVVGVRVNGSPAQLVPTGNPDDPAEVAFSATIPLNPGLNPITAVARDDRDAQTAAGIEVELVLPAVPCDANGDRVVDTTDIGLIFAARGSAASGPDDPRDVNEDGLITINDGRLCVLQCTNPRCSPEED